MILKRYPARAALLAIAIVAAGCGDDDGAPQASDASDADSGHHESPPAEDSGRPDGNAPDAIDAGRDAAGSLEDGSISQSDAGSDSGAPEPDAGTDSGPPLMLGGLTVSTTAETLESTLDLFGSAGNKLWFEVSAEQLERLNDQACCGGSDIYQPGQGASSAGAKYADHVLVQDVVTEEVADYGKVEISLVGQSTFRAWTPSSIPNVRVDTNEFVKGKRIGTFEHFRLNNSIIGTIFREHIIHSIYRALGYPALRSSYAFLGSNVWGDDVWVPMTLIEMYKRRFCEDNQDLLGGDCENMWEFAGDIGPGGWGVPSTLPDDWCQVSECDDTRLEELIAVLHSTAFGAGFKAALADYIDWDRFHQFQCLSWMVAMNDDPIHGGNNTVIIERDDGKLVWAPYSVDISAGSGSSGPLPGTYSVARGCQSDVECWADTIAVCEDLIARFDDLNPEEMVDDAVTQLTKHGMLRFNDEQHAEGLRTFLADRQRALVPLLERYRYLPDANGNCAHGLEPCNDGGCGTPESCGNEVCEPEYVFCEASQRCIYVMDHCPTCSETLPFYCAYSNTCEADKSICVAACNDHEHYMWCDYYDGCIYELQGCPDVEDDAGVAPPID